MKWIIAIVAASVLVPALALAEPRTADEWYKEGENQYNLGNFDKAIDAFKRGFELEPSDSKKAAYLFNIAQAFRQAKNCKDAQFFYKRYLAFKDADTVKPLKPEKRQEIEDRIKELDECAKQQEVIRNKPPDQNERPEGTDPKNGTGEPRVPDDKRVAVKPPTTPDPPDDDTEVRVAPVRPKVISVRATGGAAKLTTADLDVPIQATGALIAGYPLSLGDKLMIEIGAAFTFTPVPYDGMTGQSKTAQLIGAVANVGATFEVVRKLGLRGDLGVGALVFSGVSESPFTNFNATSGALTMLHVRVGLSADYAITPNVIATVTPIAFSYSPAKAGLETTSGQEISTITAIDFMIGIGYRM